jgi:hypothetical protein
MRSVREKRFGGGTRERLEPGSPQEPDQGAERLSSSSTTAIQMFWLLFIVSA